MIKATAIAIALIVILFTVNNARKRKAYNALVNKLCEEYRDDIIRLELNISASKNIQNNPIFNIKSKKQRKANKENLKALEDALRILQAG
tara:strand:- start:606 stop:875 length:270 start_codon:yes stop_codon:yes gene_type:complete